MRESTLSKVTALKERLDEDYSVATLDHLDRVYKAVERARAQTRDAIELVRGVEPSELPPDGGTTLATVDRLLKKAEVYLQRAKASAQPDIEGWGTWRDTSV